MLLEGMRVCNKLSCGGIVTRWSCAASQLWHHAPRWALFMSSRKVALRSVQLLHI